MKNIIEKNKIYISFFIISILISIIMIINKYKLFLLCSIITNLFLILLIKLIYKKLMIKYTKLEKVFVVISILFVDIFYLYSIITRKFIYYWDYSCYYNIQNTTIKIFENSLYNGIKSIFISTWGGEYGNFLSFFPQLFFEFTNKNIKSYSISNVIVFFPYIIICYSIFIKTILKKNKMDIKRKQLLFIISILSLLLFPILHGAFILGQPDLFGLTFIFLIISITIEYDFKKIEIDRLIYLFILTFMLLICRRWYIFWIVSYYLVYIISILLKNKSNILPVLKNIIIYGIIVIFLYSIALFPFIKNTIMNNYTETYSYYSEGGIITELTKQISHLGLLTLLIIISGIICGFIEKKYRKYTVMIIVQYFTILFLFSRIQNMGIHHSLLLLPIYINCINLLLVYILKQNNKTRTIIIILYLIFIITNFTFSFIRVDSKLFTDINLKIKDDENYYELKKVYEWLEKNLNENNTAYMITHNDSINPDKLRNFKTPNDKLNKFLPYGSSIIGVHKFPLELFTAKYIITTEPFEPTSVDEKYNNVFIKLKNDNKFKLIKEYNMKNNIKLQIYERIIPVSDIEKQMYIEELKEENNKYQYLYEDIINSYLID